MAGGGDPGFFNEPQRRRGRRGELGEEDDAADVFFGCVGGARVGEGFFFINRRDAEGAERILGGEDDAADAFFEDRDVEVDEKSEGKAGYFQIGDNLGFVNRS